MIEKLFDDRSQFNPERWAVLEKVCNEALPEGCYMELGCQQCGTLAYVASRFPDRMCFGFDRFDEGMTKPGPKDMAVSASYHEGAGGSSYDACVKYLEDVQREKGMLRIGLVKGDVATTFEKIEWLAPVALALVDLNLYEPTMIALHGCDWNKPEKRFRGLWHHLAPGGVILVDDLNFPGIEAALKESGIPWKQDGFLGVIRKPR